MAEEGDIIVTMITGEVFQSLLQHQWDLQEQVPQPGQEADLLLHIILAEEEIHQPIPSTLQDPTLAGPLLQQHLLYLEDPVEQILPMKSHECQTIMKPRNT